MKLTPAFVANIKGFAVLHGNMNKQHENELNFLIYNLNQCMLQHSTDLDSRTTLMKMTKVPDPVVAPMDALPDTVILLLVDKQLYRIRYTLPCC
jgi:hypothetical protein